MSADLAIWDWADRFSDAMAHRAKVARLTNDIARVGTRCGDCDKWMKSRECPAERNVNGYSRGPSCEAPKCGQFVEKREATFRRETLQSELRATTTKEPSNER